MILVHPKLEGLNLDASVRNPELWLVWLSGFSADRRTKKNVASSIPSQGTCLVFGQVLSWGRARGNQSMFLSLSSSLPSPLSKKNKQIKSQKGRKKEKKETL